MVNAENRPQHDLWQEYDAHVLGKVEVRRFTLEYDGDPTVVKRLERNFQRENAARYLPMVRASMGVVIAFLVLYTVLEVAVFGLSNGSAEVIESRSNFTIDCIGDHMVNSTYQTGLRLGGVWVPMMVLFATTRKSYNDHVQVILTVNVVIVGVMIMLYKIATCNFSYGLVCLFVTYLFSFTPIRVSFSAVISVITAAVFIVLGAVATNGFVNNLTIVSLFIFILGVPSYSREMYLRKSHLSEQVLFAKERELAVAERKTSELLASMLPEVIAKRLQQQGSQKKPQIIGENFPEVTVLFCEVCNFNRVTADLEAEEVVKLLNLLFSEFDRVCEDYGVYKVETVGQVYMVVSGCPVPNKRHSEDTSELALDFMGAVEDLQEQFMSNFPNLTEEGIRIRIGVNSGPIVAGVVGTHSPRYKLFGDTVNIASRMESTSDPGMIQISQSTYALIHNKFKMLAERRVRVKGRSEPMTTYYLHHRNDTFDADDIETWTHRRSSLEINQDTVLSDDEASFNSEYNDCTYGSHVEEQSQADRDDFYLTAVTERLSQTESTFAVHLPTSQCDKKKPNGEGEDSSAALSARNPTTSISRKQSPTRESNTTRESIATRNNSPRTISRKQSPARESIATRNNSPRTNSRKQHPVQKPDVTHDSFMTPSDEVTANAISQKPPSTEGNCETDEDTVSSLLKTASFTQTRCQSEFVVPINESNVDQRMDSRLISVLSTVRTKIIKVAPESMQSNRPKMYGTLAKQSDRVHLSTNSLKGWVTLVCFQRVNYCRNEAELFFQQESWPKRLATLRAGSVLMFITMAGWGVKIKFVDEYTEHIHTQLLVVFTCGPILTMTILWASKKRGLANLLPLISIYAFLGIGTLMIASSVLGNNPNYGSLAIAITYMYSVSLTVLWHRFVLSVVLTAGYVISLSAAIRSQRIYRSETGGNLTIEEVLSHGAFLLLFSCLQAFCMTFQEFYQFRDFQNRRLSKLKQVALTDQQEKTTTLLKKLVPPSVVPKLMSGSLVMDKFSEVTILFTDMANFTRYSSSITPLELMEFLNLMYTHFDGIVERYNLFKVEIIGDAYFAVGGCPVEVADHTERTVLAGIEMMKFVPTLTEAANTQIQLRIGIHVGPVVAGVVGIRDPRYHVFGDSVHYANQMEAKGATGEIHISSVTRDKLMNGPIPHVWEFVSLNNDENGESSNGKDDDTYLVRLKAGFVAGPDILQPK